MVNDRVLHACAHVYYSAALDECFCSRFGSRTSHDGGGFLGVVGTVELALAIIEMKVMECWRTGFPMRA